MKDTDDQFAQQVELLAEATRLQPVSFGLRVLQATSDEEIDRLVEEARKLVLLDSEQAGM